MNCPKCGNPINPNMKFCAKCGAPVAPAPQQPMQQRPVAPQQTIRPIQQKTVAPQQPAQPMQPNNAVQPQPAKKKRKKKKNLGLIITAIILVVAVLSMGGIYLADVLLYKNEVKKEGYITDFPILKKKTQLLVIDDEEFPVDEYEIKVEEHKLGGILKSDAFGRTEEVFKDKSSNPIYNINFPKDGNYRITLTGIVASRINEAEDKTEEKAETIVIIIEVKVDDDNEKAIDKAAITSKEGDGLIELPETATEANGKDDNGSKPKEEAHPIKTISYNSDGSVSWWSEYEYDSDGNNTKHTEYNSDGSVDYWHKYEYDSKGNEIKCTSYSSDGTVNWWSEYEYDSDGNNTKHTEYNSDGSVDYWIEYEYAEN